MRNRIPLEALMGIGKEQELVSGRPCRRVERCCLSARQIATDDLHVCRADAVVGNDMRTARIHADNHLEAFRIVSCLQAVRDSLPDRLDIVTRRDDDGD
jgi:hypothetical protein